MQSRMVSLQGVKCFCGGNEEVGVPSCGVGKDTFPSANKVIIKHNVATRGWYS